jgi:hypothetical protein
MVSMLFGVICRRNMRWMTTAEDLAVLEELEDAEEDYEEPEEVCYFVILL